MLMNMKELLKVARENEFAVGAFNIADSELFKVVIETAEENNSPVIVQMAPPEIAFVDDEFFAYVVQRLTNSHVPAVLHLDHGKTMEDCVHAIKCGFTSIMIDGSELPFEENKKISKEVVEIAKLVNVSVEGEIGTIGATLNSEEGGVSEIEYTKPEDVVEFVKDTGVDTLAIAIGTAHGIYAPGFVPELKLDLLDDINAVSPVPLVLHGGSANKDEEISAACKKGVAKINIASDYRKVFFDTLQDTMINNYAFWSPKAYGPSIAAAKKTVAHKMGLFDSINKADLYK